MIEVINKGTLNYVTCEHCHSDLKFDDGAICFHRDPWWSIPRWHYFYILCPTCGHDVTVHHAISQATREKLNKYFGVNL